MAFVVADRVRENTLTTGTGAVTLTGAVTGFQSFAAIGNTNTTYYTIAHQTLTEWETGIGTYSTTGPTLTRTTVISSSNGGSAVNFSAGTKDVFVSPPASTYAPVMGQAFYGVGAGAFSWTVPTNVTSVCVLCIGGGGGGYAIWSSGGGGGGGLAYKNNITVVPGAVWTVNVGLGGDAGANRQAGGNSSFVSPASVTVCQANGGTTSGGSGGTTLGYDGGGNGGLGDLYGGGGAGGYAGNGGSRGASGSGGGAAGASAYSSNYGNSGGGGVGPFGQGASGSTTTYVGTGGSGGETSNSRENGYTSYGVAISPGGRYGGGGGAPGTQFTIGYGANRGADGCVRIIWGPGRSFPSTGTGDM